MGSVVLFNAARMQAIEDGTVTTGLVDTSGHLILTRHDGSTIDAGNVKGEDGIIGVDGEPGKFVAQDTKPTTGLYNGFMWVCTLDGTTYMYYDDGTSTQWVETGSGIYNDSALVARILGVENRATILEEDSGWVNLTLNSPATASQTLRIRKLGKKVSLQGRTTGASTIVATGGIPVSMRPANDLRFLTNDGTVASNVVVVVIEASGRIITTNSTVVPNLNLEWTVD